MFTQKHLVIKKVSLSVQSVRSVKEQDVHVTTPRAPNLLLNTAPLSSKVNAQMDLNSKLLLT